MIVSTSHDHNHIFHHKLPLTSFLAQFYEYLLKLSNIKGKFFIQRIKNLSSWLSLVFEGSTVRGMIIFGGWQQRTLPNNLIEPDAIISHNSRAINSTYC